MITLYSGTPGSGKSLHIASVIYWRLKAGKYVLCNFEINTAFIRSSRLGEFTYVDNMTLTPEYLYSYSNGVSEKLGRRLKEGELFLVIDECQILFNSREWGQKNRNAWLSFFTQHRKYGFDIILVAQFDRMIDRQIRSLVEYEKIHRKANNFGFGGRLLGLFCFNRPVFCVVKTWYPLKGNNRISSEFFVAHKKYFRLYDTYGAFTAPE